MLAEARSTVLRCLQAAPRCCVGWRPPTVKVLKGLAEFEGVTLGQLLEKIVLHSFEPVPGQEGELAASPHGSRALAAIADLKRVYGMDYDVHGLG